MPEPIPFPKSKSKPSRRTRTRRRLVLEQELVRTIAINAVHQVDDVLDIFEDEETTGYFAFACAASSMALYRCMLVHPGRDEEMLTMLLNCIRAGIEDCRNQEENHAE